MIAEALAQLTPNAEWVIDGDSYEGITWLSSDITKPTKSEVTAKITELENATAYVHARKGDYPNIGEQLDMLYHDMTAGKGDKTGDWYKAIKKVKDDNPK